MATPVQRVQAIADALFPGIAPVSNARLSRWGESRADARGQLAEYQSADATGKATILLAILRAEQIDDIESKEKPAPQGVRDALESEWQ